MTRPRTWPLLLLCAGCARAAVPSPPTVVSRSSKVARLELPQASDKCDLERDGILTALDELGAPLWRAKLRNFRGATLTHQGYTLAVVRHGGDDGILRFGPDGSSVVFFDLNADTICGATFGSASDSTVVTLVLAKNKHAQLFFDNRGFLASFRWDQVNDGTWQKSPELPAERLSPDAQFRPVATGQFSVTSRGAEGDLTSLFDASGRRGFVMRTDPWAKSPFLHAGTWLIAEDCHVGSLDAEGQWVWQSALTMPGQRCQFIEPRSLSLDGEDLVLVQTGENKATVSRVDTREGKILQHVEVSSGIAWRDLDGNKPTQLLSAVASGDTGEAKSAPFEQDSAVPMSSLDFRRVFDDRVLDVLSDTQGTAALTRDHLIIFEGTSFKRYALGKPKLRLAARDGKVDWLTYETLRRGPNGELWVLATVEGHADSDPDWGGFSSALFEWMPTRFQELELPREIIAPFGARGAASESRIHLATAPGDAIACRANYCARWIDHRWQVVALPSVIERPVPDISNGVASLTSKEKLFVVDGSIAKPASVSFGRPRVDQEEESCTLLYYEAEHLKSSGDCGLGPAQGFALGLQSDVYVATKRGLVVYDGTNWRGVAGSPDFLHFVRRGTGAELWVGGDSGLWRTDLTQPGAVALATERPLPLASALPSGPLLLGADEAIEGEPLSFSIDSNRELSFAYEAKTAGGVLWLRDDKRLVEVDGEGHAHTLGNLAIERTALHALAPEQSGQGWVVGRWGPIRVEHGVVEPEEPLAIAGLHALAALNSGDLWALTCDVRPKLPGVVVRDSNGEWQLLRQLPMGCYSAAASLGAERWLVGGSSQREAWLSSDDKSNDVLREHMAQRALPASGEGILIHRVNDTWTWARIAEGALLAVAPVAPSQAWASGVKGALVHVIDGRIVHMQVPEQVSIRTILALSPNNVWFGGDAALVLHFDGKDLHRVSWPSPRPRSTIAALVPYRGNILIASPDGLVLAKVSARAE